MDPMYLYAVPPVALALRFVYVMLRPYRSPPEQENPPSYQ